MANTYVKVKINTAKILRKHHCNDAAAAKYLANLIKRHADKRVPMLSGHLKNTAQINVSGSNSVKLVYPAVYASYQYQGVSKNGNALNYHGSPTRGSEWIERTWNEDGETIQSSFASYVGGRKG